MERGTLRGEKEPVRGKLPGEATDVELAILLAGHLDNPCGVEVAPGQRETLRDFYAREARRALANMTNVWAREFLESKLREYEDR